MRHNLTWVSVRPAPSADRAQAWRIRNSWLRSTWGMAMGLSAASAVGSNAPEKLKVTLDDGSSSCARFKALKQNPTCLSTNYDSSTQPILMLLEHTNGYAISDN